MNIFSIKSSRYISGMFCLALAPAFLIAMYGGKDFSGTDTIVSQAKAADSITVTTNFPNGGGLVTLLNKNPVTIRVRPHDQGGAGWGKVWFNFRIHGLKAGQEIIIELEKGDPAIAGIAKQIVYSVDGRNWDMIKAGTASSDNKLFVYRHTVRSDKAWFAYHFPYSASEMDRLLIPLLKGNTDIKVFELTKSRKGRSVRAIDFNAGHQPRKYGIWIQARVHAFESGASWVAHYLAEWMASDDSTARSLRSIADITIVPIIDVDGVADGRTGKNSLPYDHGRSWNDTDPYWPEMQAVKSLVKAKANNRSMDLFLDIHGPGGGHHPFFIVPLEKDLPFKDQQLNRASFFSVLKAKPLEERVKNEQSMTEFHYSARSMDKFEPAKSTPPQWATIALNKHIIAMTMETNMNSPVSTLDGYREQAHKLGNAIALYFLRDMHRR